MKAVNKPNNKKLNQIGKIKTYYIILKSILLCFKVCIITIYLSFSKKPNKNQLVDNQVRNWARKIIGYTKAQIIVKNPEKIQIISLIF